MKDKLWIVLQTLEQKGGIEEFSENLASALRDRFNISFIYLHAPNSRYSDQVVQLNKKWPIKIRRLLMRWVVKRRDYVVFNQPGHLKYLNRDTDKVYLVVHNPSEIDKFEMMNGLPKLKLLCVANHIIAHLNKFKHQKLLITPPISSCQPSTAQYDGTFRFLYLGRLVPEKGVSKAIELLARIAAINPAFQMSFTMYGEGGEKANLKQQIDTLDLENLQIEIKPWVPRDQICNLFKDYDFYLGLSQIEGMPIAVREAMSAGIIPVVSDIPAHQEIVNHGLNGFIVDDTVCAEDYLLLLEGKDKINAMREQAIANVQQHQMQNFQDQVITIFNLK